MTEEQKDILCIANRETNAGFSMRKPRKLTGESGAEMRTDGGGGARGEGEPFPHLPKCSLLISDALFFLSGSLGMDYESLVHICPQEIINSGECFCGWHCMNIR